MNNLAPQGKRFAPLAILLPILILVISITFASPAVAFPGKQSNAGSSNALDSTAAASEAPVRGPIVGPPPATQPSPSEPPASEPAPSDPPASDPVPSEPAPSEEASTSPGAGGIVPRQQPAPALTTTNLVNVPASGSRLVFAHYFPPYPVSIDNKNGSADYYAVNYNTVNGESGKHAAYGGLLRDRPMIRAPRGGDWKLEDMKDEIRYARAAGIDGFAVDILSTSGRNWDAVNLLLKAAPQVSPQFRVMLQPDMTAPVGSLSAVQLADAMASIARHPAVYKIGGERVVISPFKAENTSVAYWSEFKNLMQSRHGISVVLFPLLLDFSKMASFAPISYGVGNWGVRNPASITNGPNYAAAARGYGLKYMAPIAMQDYRPRAGLYEEAGNTEALRASWNRAINDNADFALLVTWNDYSESTHFAPSIDHGFALLDVSSYYSTWFRTGRVPALASEAVVLTHRPHANAVIPTGHPKYATPWPGTSRTKPRDTVEVLTFLKAPAEVTVRVGAQTHRYTAPAGINAKLLPLSTGSVSASAARSGATFAQVKTTATVTAGATVQDLGYYASISTRPNPQQP